MHDGRADTLDEAIRYHDGEAKTSREAYEALGDADRADVIAFLNSLGGAAQKSDGLLPPDAEIPSAATTADRTSRSRRRIWSGTSAAAPSSISTGPSRAGSARGSTATRVERAIPIPSSAAPAPAT